MAVQYIKRGKTEGEKHVVDASVQDTVKTILNDIRERGSAAVREMSQRLDQWSPERFRLSDAQIQRLVDSLPAQTIDDIQFAQEQVRKFATAQREAIRDIEVETLPGVRL